MIDKIAMKSKRSPPFVAFLDDLAAVGVQPATGGQSFGLLAGRSNARWWLFPLDQGRACASAGLEMFQAVSRAAQFGKMAMQLRASYAPATFRGQQRTRLSGTPAFLDLFEEKGLCCAYFTGTDGPSRKTSAQIMSPDGEIVGYVKLTRDPELRPFLETEASYLQVISSLSLTSVLVPKVIDLNRDAGVAWLVTDSLRNAETRVGDKFGDQHRRFLSELSARTRDAKGGQALSDLSMSLEKLRPSLTPEWDQRFIAGIERLSPHAPRMPTAMAHGDFTPWNAFLLGDRLYVFDWEYARSSYPVGYDCAHYILSANRLMRPRALLDGLLIELSRLFYDGDTSAAFRALLMSLLLHADFSFRRAHRASGSAHDWEESARYADFVDVLLASGNS